MSDTFDVVVSRTFSVPPCEADLVKRRQWLELSGIDLRVGGVHAW